MEDLKKKKNKLIGTFWDGHGIGGVNHQRKKAALCKHGLTVRELRLSKGFLPERGLVLHTTWNAPGSLTGLKPSTGMHWSAWPLQKQLPLTMKS